MARSPVAPNSTITCGGSASTTPRAAVRPARAGHAIVCGSREAAGLPRRVVSDRSVTLVLLSADVRCAGFAQGQRRGGWHRRGLYPRDGPWLMIELSPSCVEREGSCRVSCPLPRARLLPEAVAGRDPRRAGRSRGARIRADRGHARRHRPLHDARTDGGVRAALLLAPPRRRGGLGDRRAPCRGPGRARRGGLGPLRRARGHGGVASSRCCSSRRGWCGWASWRTSCPAPSSSGSSRESACRWRSASSPTCSASTPGAAPCPRSSSGWRRSSRAPMCRRCSSRWRCSRSCWWERRSTGASRWRSSRWSRPSSGRGARASPGSASRCSARSRRACPASPCPRWRPPTWPPRCRSRRRCSS